MLAVTTDWALTDGSLGPSRAGRAVVWLEAIRLAVGRSGWRADGRYRPVAAATIVFAGDTFDWLLSDVWAGTARPWRAGRGAAEARARVAAATIRSALPMLRTLRHWTRAGITVPGADERGRPVPRRSAVATVLPVFLAGDRDWWLQESAAAAGRLGCLVGEEWADGATRVGHGHEFEPLTHAAVPLVEDRGRAPSLGESLAIELIVRFGVAARSDAGLWPLVRPALATLSAARPSALPGRIAALLDAAGGRAGNEVRTRLTALWRSSVARWHGVARREVPACEAEFDVVDELAGWFERIEAGAVPPAAVAGLERPVAAGSWGRGVRQGSAGCDPPSLVVISGDGCQRRLPLAPESPGPAIVAVGGGAGTGFVDAA